MEAVQVAANKASDDAKTAEEPENEIANDYLANTGLRRDDFGELSKQLCHQTVSAAAETKELVAVFN